LSRKLLILDLALIAAVIFTGVRVRDQVRAAKEREAAILKRKAAPTAPPPLAPLAPVPPAMPSSYVSIAQNMLFDKSRNSTVVVEPPPAPPPKPPMPPLPFYHGQMRLPGEGPIVILSLASDKQHEAVHPGEEIGPFKLVGATSQELSFEWEGQVIRKSLDELIDRSGGGSSAPAAGAAAPAGPRPSAPPPPAAKAQVGPGADVGNGVKACVPNDSYEDGAVVDGYRKSVKRSPFGTLCEWDQVK
jgi:hypothetical protein